MNLTPMYVHFVAGTSKYALSRAGRQLPKVLEVSTAKQIMSTSPSTCTRHLPCETPTHHLHQHPVGTLRPGSLTSRRSGLSDCVSDFGRRAAGRAPPRGSSLVQGHRPRETQLEGGKRGQGQTRTPVPCRNGLYPQGPGESSSLPSALPSLKHSTLDIDTRPISHLSNPTPVVACREHRLLQVCCVCVAIYHQSSSINLVAPWFYGPGATVTLSRPGHSVTLSPWDLADNRT